MDDNRFLNAYKKKLVEPDAKTDQPSAGTDPAVTGPGQPSAGPDQPPAGPDQSELSTLRYEEKPAFVAPRPVLATGRSSRPGSRLVPAAVVLATVLILVFFLIWLFNRGIAIIDLTGWSLSDAQLWAGDKGIRLQVDEAFDDQFDVDKIIRQDPGAGSSLKKGGFLKVTVSLGHDLSVTLPLPDLLSMTMAEVETWAEDNYMTKVRITADYSEDVASGSVISYEINDETVVDLVRRDTPIYVVVSRGPEPQTEEKVTVPDFTVLSVVQSQQFAKDNGIILKIIEQYDDFTSEGSIIDQSEAAETEVLQGTEITLTVSKGKKILVPDFADYSRQKAAAVAADLGIAVSVSERYSSKSADSFISQSMAPGEIYATGDIIELVYSLGNKIVLNSFVGQTRAAIESWARELNEQGASIRVSVTQTQSNSPKDTIIYQDKTNIIVSTDTTVRITVSLGRMVFVPDLVAPEGSGYDKAVTREQALAACEALNIIPVFVAENKTGRLPGEIWYQSVAAGQEVFEQTTITLKYNPAGVTVTVPDFTGLSQAEIIEAGYMRKLTITFVVLDDPVAGYANTVCQQSIPADQTVAAGTAITLSIGPAEPDPDPTAATDP